MKPSELYALEVKEVWKDLWVLNGCYYHHVPELEAVWSMLDFSKNEKVELRVFGHVNYDTRRFWLLAGVYFDGHPVMVIRNAGREGDDHHSRFITDGGRYFDLVKYLAGLANPKRDVPLDVVDVEKDIPDLCSFYGESLETSRYRWKGR